MTQIPEPVADFLRARRLAVAGVSRDSKQAANAVFRKLKKSGYEVFPINPQATEVEGTKAFPDVASLPAPVDGLVVATHPSIAPAVVHQCAEAGVPRVWFHRSFGQGSVSEEAVGACREAGLACIVGGCPLMYCEPVDFAHRAMRWWLRRGGRVPG